MKLRNKKDGKLKKEKKSNETKNEQLDALERLYDNNFSFNDFYYFEDKNGGIEIVIKAKIPNFSYDIRNDLIKVFGDNNGI